MKTQISHREVSAAYQQLLNSIEWLWAIDAALGPARAGTLITPWRNRASLVNAAEIVQQVRSLAGTPYAGNATIRAEVISAMGAALEDVELDKADPDYLVRVDAVALLRRIHALAA